MHILIHLLIYTGTKHVYIYSYEGAFTSKPVFVQLKDNHANGIVVGGNSSSDSSSNGNSNSNSNSNGNRNRATNSSVSIDVDNESLLISLV